MNNFTSNHSIAPAKVVRGKNAWNKSKRLIKTICQSPILIGRSKATLKVREQLFQDMQSLGLSPMFACLEFDCCELDINRLISLAYKNNCDGVIASGGGKVLDAGKLLAERLSLPCITIPLSASTCAGWTALANIYSPEGSFIKDESLEKCPELLVFDHNFVKNAPAKTLASGIADALAKWYESSITSNSSKDGLVQQAVQMSRVLRDQLLIDGKEAYLNKGSEAWERVAEGCALTAGLIGGIGGERSRTAAAHAIHNGLTQIKQSNQSIHGEIVGFGVLSQLKLEEIITGSQLATQARLQLLPFLKELNLPTSMKDLQLEDVSLIELQNACDFACNCSDMNSLPFKVNPDILLKTLLSSTKKNISSIL